MATERITRLPLPVFLTLTDWVLLVVFTTWWPNVSAELEILNTGEVTGANVLWPPPHPSSDTTISETREPTIDRLMNETSIGQGGELIPWRQINYRTPAAPMLCDTRFPIGGSVSVL